METEKRDYRATVLTPKTDFPMKANLAQREPERLRAWAEKGLYKAIQASRAGAPTYILHDGPPYANGDIHVGHSLNKILKDIIVRYKTMKGFRSPYVPGWDCHGLPIEQQVGKKLGAKLHQMEPVQIRKLCHEYADKFVGIQREQFKRLGVMGEWDRPYLTTNPGYEAGILSLLRDLVQKGLIRKGLKPVHWDPVFQTALAEAEIEYETHVSDSIYVKFPIRDAERVPALRGLANPSIVIWTTTPWTLPANLAVCLHPEYEYVALRVGPADVQARADDNGRVLAPAGIEHYVVARGLLEKFKADCGITGGEVVATFGAAPLERMECDHPIFPDKSSLVILGRHVTLEMGTGGVHTAPGHGMDDYLIAGQYGLPIFVPVDNAGRYTDDYPEMKGVNVFEANPRIIEKLAGEGRLLAASKFSHEYPHSWRSHKPIIFRATSQWFMELGEGGVRERALNAIDEAVQWVPQWGRDRIHAMVSQRPDWCLSRQRSWGVPIPAIRHKASGRSILDIGLMNKFIARVEEVGTDAWYAEPLSAFWPENFVDEASGDRDPEAFEKEWDILDVWFDSGASHVAVLERDERLSAPADLYLEGSDQHRGWFQSSLLTSIGARDRAPFRQVLTHGFVLDGQGRAMSKSLGNTISPLDIVNKLGADILRLWVCSEDYRSDLRVSDSIMERVGEAYRRIRNTFRFLVGNLYDFDPAKDAAAPGDLEEMDRWALAQLARLIEKVDQAYEEFQFHRVYHLVYAFCNSQLSAVYLDALKDRLYCSAPADLTRRAGQTVLWRLLDALCRLTAPLLVFTAEEAWEFGNMPGASAHLADFPKPDPEWTNPGLIEKWDRLLELRGEVAVALEEARRSKIIGHSLDASVEVSPLSAEEREFLTGALGTMKTLFIVSDIRLGEDRLDPEKGPDGRPARPITVTRGADAKCERCWTLDPSVGRDSVHPGLCDRCSDVIHRLGPNPQG